MKSIRPRTRRKYKDRLPKMRLRRAWRHYPAGAIIQPPGVLRQVLVAQDIAEVVEDAPEATPPPPAPVKKRATRRKPADTDEGAE